MQSTKRWKSGNPDWREGPAFLDATSSVSASTFGARRLPELKNLYFETRLGNNDDHIIHERKNCLSAGGKRSSRHLRRRTTAIHSKRRHRYPSPNKTPEYKGLTRKSKRKKSQHLESSHLQWMSPKSISESASIDEEDEPNQTSTSKMWQVTHRWHAKRFHLLSATTTSHKEKKDPILGGWVGIPLVHSNRGPRATIRLSQNKDKSSELSSVMVRDVTWEEQPLVLKVTRPNNHKASNPEEEAQFLLQQLGEICPGLIQLGEGGEALSDFFSGKRSIQETLHEPDSFPSGAIGPGCLRMVPRNDELGAEIRCHPSIRPRIQELLQQIASSIPSSSSLRLKPEAVSEHIPKICFRLYGGASLNALNKVLGLFEGKESEFLEQHEIRESSSGALPNGSIIRVNGVRIPIEMTNTVVDNIILIYRAPRPLDCPANCAMAGWEIHCSKPTFAKAVWLSLVTLDGTAPSSTSTTSNQKIRGCCAIGLIDDCHMRLECEPPIPVFPRDYVDTEDSQNYWRPTVASCSWKRIRQLCEGGWGRLPIDKEKRLDKLETIDFDKLVALDESENESKENIETQSSIVVVRGAFGQPFVDAIRASCGNYTSSGDAITKKRRRNRRPSCSKNKVLVAPPLSEASKDSLGDYCNNLSSSLTLPAALLVHVRIIGQGTIAPGMAVVGAGTEELMLGKITAGGFSSSRGVCHGIGMVGAVRLLDYLARTTRSEDRSEVSYGRVVRLANGSQSRQLLVRVVTMTKDGSFETSGYEASLEALI